MASKDPLRFSQPPAEQSSERDQLIALAAYYLAEKRQFSGGSDADVNDWLEAEAQVDRELAQKHLANITRPKAKAKPKADKSALKG